MSDDTNSNPLNRTYCPALNLLPPDSASHRYNDAVSYFRSIRWCEELLDAADTYTFLPNCRNAASSNHRAQFMASTLATDNTLRHVLGFFQVDATAALSNASIPIRKAHVLFMPEEGLGGVGTMLHGGVIMTMLDEAANILLEINTVMGKDAAMFQAGSVTGSMDIKFRMPIIAGEPVLFTAWLQDEEIKGRKMKIQCEAQNEDGDQLVKATSTWFVVSSRL